MEGVLLLTTWSGMLPRAGQRKSSADLVLTPFSNLCVQEAPQVHFLGDNLSIQKSEGKSEASNHFLAIPVIVLGGNPSIVDKTHSVTWQKNQD